MVAAIAVEFVLLRGELTLWSARRLQVADAVLGIAATLLLLVGLARVFWFEKGAAYYFHNHAFLTKFALFIIVALLSIVPTLEFLSWRKAVKAGQVPAVAAAQAQARAHDRAHRAGGDRAHPVVRRDDGEGRMGLSSFEHDLVRKPVAIPRSRSRTCFSGSCSSGAHAHAVHLKLRKRYFLHFGDSHHTRQGDTMAAPNTRDWIARENVHKPKGLHLLVGGQVEVSHAQQGAATRQDGLARPEVLGLDLTIVDTDEPAATPWSGKAAHYHEEVDERSIQPAS